METYFVIIQDLDNELSKFKNVSDNISDQMGYVICYLNYLLYGEKPPSMTVVMIKRLRLNSFAHEH